MVNVYITHDDDSLIIRTIPFTIVGTQGFWLASVDDTHQSDRHAIAILIALVKLRQIALQHELLTHHAHAILVVYHVALVVDSLLGQRDAVAPILEDEHAGIHCRGAGGRHIGEVINGFVDAGIGIQVSAILHTDALQVILQGIALEVVGTVEGEVLQKVSQTALVIILIDRTHFLSDVETCHMLRESIMTNVVGQSIVEMAYLHILVHWDRRHLLCRRISHREQQQCRCENLL